MVFPAARRFVPVKNKSLQLGIVALLVGIGVSCIDTVWSVYLDSFLHSMSSVGLVTGMLSLLAVLTYLFISPVLERNSQALLWLIGICATILSYLLFGIVQSPGVFLAVAAVLVVATVVRVVAYGIIVRDANKISSIGTAEGMVYALVNVGWLIGPLIGGFVATLLGYKPVFLFAALFIVLGAALFLLVKPKAVAHHTNDDATLRGSLRNMRAFFANPALVRTYVLSGGISLYWGIVYIFIPLFIIRSGLPSYWVGLFLFAVGVPLALLEYWAGATADKVGFKRFFTIGYAILMVASLYAFFFSGIYSVMIVFTLASIGAALIEGNRESYFFRITRKSEEERFYGPYLTHTEVFSTIGKLMAAALLAFLVPNALFLLLALQMLFFLWVASTLPEDAKQPGAVKKSRKRTVGQ